MQAYSNPVQTTQRKESVNQTGDKADDIVLPSSIVDPRPEHELGVVMGRCLGHDHN